MRIQQKIDHFIKLPGVKSALSTLLLFIPIITGFWESWAIYYKILLLITYGGVNSVFVYIDNKRPSIKIEKMLELMLGSLWGEEAHHFRSNVMIFDSKTKRLQIQYSCHMQGAIDRNLSLDPKQGCAGKAFSSNLPYVVDLTTATHNQYNIDPTKVWKSMKSVMSVPICDDEHNEHVIGVLSIDSDLDYNTVKFREDKVLNTANTYADFIGEWL